MAIWQADFYLLPKAEIPSGVSRLSRQEFEEDHWWKRSDRPGDAFRDVLRGLPELPTWSQALQMWGEMDGNRVDVIMGAGGLEEIRIRVDARNPHRSFLGRVVGLAAALDCIILTDTLEVVPPLVGELEGAVRSSAAGQFVRDPPAFLDDPEGS